MIKVDKASIKASIELSLEEWEVVSDALDLFHSAALLLDKEKKGYIAYDLQSVVVNKILEAIQEEEKKYLLANPGKPIEIDEDELPF